jgi:hypothetical protein
VPPAPAIEEASDELFVLVVRSPADRYRPDEPMDITAELIYQGPRNQETIYHAASPVGWQIVQLNGDARMEGGMDTPCLTTRLTPGAVRKYPFDKAGAVDHHPPFDIAWFRDPALRLPAGQWRAIATLSVALGDCGGEDHRLEAAIDIVVEP